MVYFMGKPNEKIDDLGVPLFLETPILKNHKGSFLLHQTEDQTYSTKLSLTD